jgi:hypothetical protein
MHAANQKYRPAPGSVQGFAVFRDASSNFRSYDFSERTESNVRSPQSRKEKKEKGKEERSDTPRDAGFLDVSSLALTGSQSEEYTPAPIPFDPNQIETTGEKFMRRFKRFIRFVNWALLIVVLLFILSIPLQYSAFFASTTAYLGFRRDDKFLHIGEVATLSSEGVMGILVDSPDPLVSLALTAPEGLEKTRAEIGHIASDATISIQFGPSNSAKDGLTAVAGRITSFGPQRLLSMDGTDSSRNNENGRMADVSSSSSTDDAKTSGKLYLNTHPKSGDILMGSGSSRIGLNTLTPAAVLHVIGDCWVIGNGDVSGTVDTGWMEVREEAMFGGNVSVTGNATLGNQLVLSQALPGSSWAFTGNTIINQLTLSAGCEVAGDFHVDGYMPVTEGIQVGSGLELELLGTPPTSLMVLSASTASRTTVVREVVKVANGGALSGHDGSLTAISNASVDSNLCVGPGDLFCTVKSTPEVKSKLERVIIGTDQSTMRLTLKGVAVIAQRYEANNQIMECGWNGVHYHCSFQTDPPIWEIQQIGTVSTTASLAITAGSLNCQADLTGQQLFFNGTATLGDHVQIGAAASTHAALQLTSREKSFAWINRGDSLGIQALIDNTALLTFSPASSSLRSLRVHGSLIILGGMTTTGNWEVIGEKISLASLSGNSTYTIQAPMGFSASWTLTSGPISHLWQATAAQSLFSIGGQMVMNLSMSDHPLVHLATHLRLQDGNMQVEGGKLELSQGMTTPGMAIQTGKGSDSVTWHLYPTDNGNADTEALIRADATQWSVGSSQRVAWTVAAMKPDLTIHDAVQLSNAAVLQIDAGRIALSNSQAGGSSHLNISSALTATLRFTRQTHTETLSLRYHPDEEVLYFIPGNDPINFPSRTYLLALNASALANYAMRLDGSFSLGNAATPTGQNLSIETGLLTLSHSSSQVILAASATTSTTTARLTLRSSAQGFQFSHLQAEGLQLRRSSDQALLWQIGQPGKTAMHLHTPLTVRTGQVTVGTALAGQAVNISLHAGAAVVHSMETTGSDWIFRQNGQERLRFSSGSSQLLVSGPTILHGPTHLTDRWRLHPTPLTLSDLTQRIEGHVGTSSGARLRLVQNNLPWSWDVPADGSQLSLTIDDQVTPTAVWQLTRSSKETTLAGDLTLAGGQVQVLSTGADATFVLEHGGNNNALFQMSEDLHTVEMLLDRTAALFSLRNPQLSLSLLSVAHATSLLTVGGDVTCQGEQVSLVKDGSSVAWHLQGGGNGGRAEVKLQTTAHRYLVTTTDNAFVLQWWEASTKLMELSAASGSAGNLWIKGNLDVAGIGAVTSLSVGPANQFVVLSDGKISQVGDLTVTESMTVGSGGTASLSLDHSTASATLQDMGMSLLSDTVSNLWTLSIGGAIVSKGSVQLGGDITIGGGGGGTPSHTLSVASGNWDSTGEVDVGTSLLVATPVPFSVSVTGAVSMGACVMQSDITIVSGSTTTWRMDSGTNPDVTIASSLTSAGALTVEAGTGLGQLSVVDDGSGDAAVTFAADFDVTGDVYAQSATQSSDRRLKENIERLRVEESMEALKHIKAVSFAFTARPTQRYDGFLAQDLQELLPHAVRKHAEKETETLALDMAHIVANLWEVLQYLQAEKNELQSLVAELEMSQSSVSTRNHTTSWQC